MRFMMIVKANEASEAGIPPSRELIEAMGRFNEEMVNAGVMLAGEGLYPSSQGARIYFRDGRRIVTDGPFAETKELIAGYWIIQADSLQEAIDWAKRVPDPMEEGQDAVIEIRQIFEDEDFAPEIMTAEERERERRMRERLASAGTA